MLHQCFLSDKVKIRNRIQKGNVTMFNLSLAQYKFRPKIHTVQAYVVTIVRLILAFFVFFFLSSVCKGRVTPISLISWGSSLF